MFKIEGFAQGQWYELPGEPGYNEFQTEEEAAALIPQLARDMDSSEDGFRVVEE